MTNELFTIFVSETGKHDHTAFLWVETDSREIYEKALAAVEPNGYKVSKIYKPSDELSAPNFAKVVNRIK